MTKRSVKIAPSILSADFSNMAAGVKRAEAAGADMIHCDVMDGVFVPNLTFGFKMIEDIKKSTRLPLDVHLMIVEPERYVERFVKAGADIVTFHIEACKSVPETLAAIKAAGARRGLVINPHTPVDGILPYLKDCDMVLVMSVMPGFGGQKFMPHVLDKVRTLKKIAVEKNYTFDIEIDGGITIENASEVKAAGVNVIVAGNTLFAAKDMKAAVEGLR